MDDALFDRYEAREAHTIALAAEVLDDEMALDDEEENIDPALVCAHNLCDNEARMKIITGLSIEQFLDVYAVVADVLPVVTGRGPRSKIGGRDRLLMTLCYLKHYETLDKMKDTFHVSRSHLHRVLETTIDVITPVLYQRFVTEGEPWALLVDSGYQGLQHTLPAILPQKRRAGHEFTRDQRDHNRRLARHRVVCEQFYGRLKAKWRIMTSKYRNDRDDYAKLFRLCAALTQVESSQ